MKGLISLLPWDPQTEQVAPQPGSCDCWIDPSCPPILPSLPTMSCRLSWIQQVMGKDGRWGHSGNQARLWTGRNGFPDTLCPFTLPGVREKGMTLPAKETSGHCRIPKRQKEGLGVWGKQVSHPQPLGLTIRQWGGNIMHPRGVPGCRRSHWRTQLGPFLTEHPQNKDGEMRSASQRWAWWISFLSSLDLKITLP